jgi:hypothetical protein
MRGIVLAAMLLAAPVLAKGRSIVISWVGEEAQPFGFALKHALIDEDVYNATLIKDALTAKGIIPIVDFERWSAAPPPGWPAELNDRWEAGLSYCRALVPPPPWRGDLVPGSCGELIASYFWQQLLEQKKPDVVYEIKAMGSGGTVQVEVVSYAGANATTWKRLSENARGGEALIDRVVKAALEGKGESGTRYPTKELPAPATDPFEQPAVATSVPGLKTCAQLPKRLKVTPVGALAKSVSDRWAASVPEGGVEEACTLSAWTSSTSVSLPGVPAVSAALKCGKTHVAVELAQKLGQDAFSAKLLTRFAAKRCSEKP